MVPFYGYGVPSGVNVGGGAMVSSITIGVVVIELNVGNGVDVGGIMVDVGDGVDVVVGVAVGVGVSVGVGVGVGVGCKTLRTTRFSVVTGSCSVVKGLSGPNIIKRKVAGPERASSVVSQ